MLLFRILHTLISRLLLLIVVLIFLIPILLFMFLPEKWRYSRPLFFCVDLFYRAALWCTLVPITYKGVSNIPNEPVIFIANHQSSLDIPLLGKLAHGVPHIWLATSDLMRSPLLRWIVPRLSVLVDVRTPLTAMRCLLKIIKMSRNTNRHLMVFPEGSRFEDGEVHEFFNGFVILAKKTGRPVIPVFLKGVNKVYPRQSFLITWHPLEVIVGSPFCIAPQEDEEQFKKQIHDWFKSLV